MAFLHEQTDFGTAAARAFTAAARERGIEVGPIISYDATTVSDFTAQITQVKASGADVLAVAGLLRRQPARLTGDRRGETGPQRRMGGVQRRVRPTQVRVQRGGDSELYFNTNYHYDANNPQTREFARGVRAPLRRADADGRGPRLRRRAGDRRRRWSARAAPIPEKVRDAIAESEVEPADGRRRPDPFAANGDNENAVPVLTQVQDGRVTAGLSAGEGREPKPDTRWRGDDRATSGTKETVPTRPDGDRKRAAT